MKTNSFYSTLQYYRFLNLFNNMLTYLNITKWYFDKQNQANFGYLTEITFHNIIWTWSDF